MCMAFRSFEVIEKKCIHIFMKLRYITRLGNNINTNREREREREREGERERGMEGQFTCY